MAGSDIRTPPWCPFCGQTVGRPAEPKQRKMGEFSVGKCQCGAVYSCDPTGFNVGAAMVDAMVYACNDDWDMAWELIPEEDYLIGRIENYDEQTHQVVETKNLDGRKIKGVLFFVRLHKDIAEISSRLEGKEIEINRSASYLPPIEPDRDPKRARKKASKSLVRTLVESQDMDGLVDLAFDDTKTLRFMQRLLYTPDETLRWQTINALGKVCARLATRKPGKVSDLLHRLFAACSDSASSSWGAVEAIGAIIGERPDIFGAFTRHLLNYLSDTSRQVAVLWALGTIAKHRPDLIRTLPFYNLFTFAGHPEAQYRGHALRLFGRIKAVEIVKNIEELLNDNAHFVYYEEGRLINTDICTMAQKALDETNSSQATQEAKTA